MAKTLEKVETVVAVPVAQLRAHPFEPRKSSAFSKAALEPLSRALEANGVDPLVVRPHPDGKGWEVLAGHRRLAALELAGAKSAPCVVREMDDAAALRFLVADNVAHEAADPFMEAQAIKRLLGMKGATLESVANGLGWSVRRTARRRELLNLSPEVLEEHRQEGASLSMWPVTWLEVVAQLDASTQAVWLRTEHPNGMSSIEEVERSVAQYTRELSKATWDLADAKLVPTAGACTACPFQSTHAPGLFAAPKKASDLSRAVCRKIECWRKKVTASAAQTVRARLEKDEDLVCLKSGAGGSYGADKYDVATARAPKGAESLDWHEWVKCAKDDKGARHGVLVSGPAAGELVWFKRRPSGSGVGGGYSYASKPETPAEQLKRAEKDLAEARACAVGDAVNRVLNQKDLPTPSTAHVLAWAAVFGIEASSDHEVLKDLVAAPTEPDKWAAFVWPSVADAAAQRLRSRYCPDPDGRLKSCALVLLGVGVKDPEGIVQKAVDSVPVPDSLEKLRREVQGGAAAPVKAGKPKRPKGASAK